LKHSWNQLLSWFCNVPSFWELELQVCDLNKPNLAQN
jgi:hypothetical protein